MRFIRSVLTLILLGITFTVYSQQYNVNWADVTGATLTGNQLTKNTSNGWGNSGAGSYNILYANQSGWVQMVVSSSPPNKVAIGLTSIYVGPDYATFDFAYLLNNKVLFIYERGVLKAQVGNVKLNDVIRIERVGSSIVYKKNGTEVYQSVPPTSQILVASYTSDLVVGASLFNNGSVVSSVTCSFPNKLRVDGNIQNQLSDSALGSITLSIAAGPSAYQVAWNGLVVPSKNLLGSIVDSIWGKDSVRMDTTFTFHQADSLRHNKYQFSLQSGKYSASVIDSITDTVSLNANVNPILTWYTRIGVAISSSPIPRYVSRIANDSSAPLLEGQPNLSQPIVTFNGQMDSGIITKTANNGWNSGRITSSNLILADRYADLSFVVPNSNTLLSAGLKLSSVSDQTGYSDILYGYYFNNGQLSLIVNGASVNAGAYTAGNRFTLENAYDSAKHLERIFYKQNGHLLRIVYIPLNSGGTGNPGGGTYSISTSYLFKVALNTSGASLIIGSLSGATSGTQPQIVSYIITPASCGFPNSASITINVSTPPSVVVTGYLWTNTTTLATYTGQNISNIGAGIYKVRISYTYNGHPHFLDFTPLFVGYKVYWVNLNHAASLGGPNSNTIYQNPPGFANQGSGQSTNHIAYPAGTGSWVQFDLGSIPFFNVNNNNTTLAYGYKNVSNSFLGPGFYVYTFNGNFYVFGVGFSYFSLVSSASLNTYILQNYNNGPFKIYHNNTLLIPPSIAAGISQTASYVVGGAALGGFYGSILHNAICSFLCGDTSVQYATLTKILDGSYYLLHSGRLSFKYDEEYVGNLSGLAYNILDKQRNSITSGFLTPDNYKDNYYNVDLSGYSLVPNDFYILQITNKKGEVTELRIKN